MGIAFSSSLFGLAGALFLGFIDLQINRAQNEFINFLDSKIINKKDNYNIKNEEVGKEYSGNTFTKCRLFKKSRKVNGEE